MNEHQSRRNFLKTSTLAMGTGLIANTALANKIPKKMDEVIIGHNSHKYKVVAGWGVLDADKNPVNDCHEMVEDAKGRLIMCTNETKNNILIYDKSGKLLEAWGTTYPGAHGLTISNEGGEQFLFICDNARHQVIKTDLKGREVMKLEYPKETGVYESPNRFVPTETAVNPANGDIYVADGYGSQYITQYDNKGRYIRHFGGYSKEYADEKFDTCHGILVDTRDKKNPTLLITDRSHTCMKRFTLDGKFLAVYHLPGTFVCRPVLHGDYIFAAAYRSSDQSWNNSGYIQVMDKNMKVISTPGGSEPIYKDGKLQRQHKDDPNQVFMHPHDVWVDSDENIYVPQWSSKKTYPIKLERIA
ncbi:twin-arginine translocation signal domain-containing protein [Arcicella lustrica]|uniref:Twin-arginine translocation signal domain-containing protein n=1 Tax=Arcicella lustrica TaxID=2984196 RepID=A0ABU5SD47_9BACT|nr:twin-arginine translocation signal domain-containing protein [Arcicella sp. DC25W]MEA5425215.1 twin-arginine translocation signal domain-containing protein [Arcicella sp. DC25W]